MPSVVLAMEVSKTDGVPVFLELLSRERAGRFRSKQIGKSAGLCSVVRKAALGGMTRGGPFEAATVNGC